MASRIANRDEAALGVVYDRYAGALFGSVVRFLGDREAAADVVQETFLTLWLRADTFDPAQGTLIGWLLTVSRNKATDRWRAAARRPIVESIAADGDSAGIDDWDRVATVARSIGDPDPVDDPDRAAALRWARAVVRTALATMSEAERTVLELAYDDGLAQSEIAVRLGWPLGTVKSRTRRAMATLRGMLESVPDLHDGVTAGRSPMGDTRHV